MLSSDIKGSRKLFWRNVRNECERLCEAIISKRMTQNDMTGGIDSEQSTLDTNVSWEDWIFEESRRRLCLIYRVVNMLVYFEPAALCNLPTNIIIAPLPAKKQLWEANDELSWNSESQRSPGYQTAFALTASGEVVELDDDHVHCTDALLPPKSLDDHYSLDSTANWEEWCSGMDGLGGLVMLAASLVV
ncbi:hypothetical protein N7462_010295 [Penicillium macrosclerotiorum]|uniref:uncharacterized protein n=1 Tax=Penicillium macrosclerotiorum TaxID=303699 RepID=UPI0025471F94|nr:uncharacterized protein N7462_010295 [Penicillium macrosclerotiorum]KAJ5669225.1 hypothetical protein N7462_010295 [Penicillium macrosclerotiorum]